MRESTGPPPGGAERGFAMNGESGVNGHDDTRPGDVSELVEIHLHRELLQERPQDQPPASASRSRVA